MNDPPVLEIFTDYVCPWCYLCTPDVARLQREYPIRVRWTYYPLHPDTPPEGLPLPPSYLEFQHRVALLAAEAGLPFVERSRRYNSRRAQELGKWASVVAGGARLHDLLYRAYFAGNLNIWDIDVLAAQAAAAGLDPGEARRVLTAGTFAAAVDEDWERAQREGISGVPTFFHPQLRIVGAQPYAALEQFVLRLLDR